MHIIEENVLFSESILWDKQKGYYQRVGIDVWNKFNVPSYITSNPVIAESYARVAAGYLRDMQTNNSDNGTFYMLELGAGHGRFSYYFLRHLLKITERSSFKYPKFCYVISDCVEKNLHFLEKHPKLIPYVEQGILDFSLFEAETTDTLNLRHSRITLSKGSISQPLFVIANYFFDVLRQDLFYIKDNELHDCPIILHKKEESDDKREILRLDDLIIGHTHKKRNVHFFEEEAFNKIMDDYRNELSDTYLLFPTAGIRCIEKLRNLSAGLVLLTADKGYNRHEQLDGLPFPSLITHDNSFSLMVNYHAFQMFCHYSGGDFIIPKHVCSSIYINCFLFIPNSEDCKETRLEYDAYIAEYNPDDFCTLITSDKNDRQINFQQWAAMIRYSGYDSRMFTQLLPKLYNLISGLSYYEKLSLSEIIDRIWDWLYDLEDDNDVELELGKMLNMSGFPEKAVFYLQMSVKNRGYKIEVLQNLLFCYLQIKDYQSGIALFQKLETIAQENK